MSSPASPPISPKEKRAPSAEFELTAPAVLPPLSAVDPKELERLRAEAILRRERVERVMATPSPVAIVKRPPPPPPGAPEGPTEEERRARAEHLKRQRDALLQKRAKEREEQ